ncbi:hypothetical protein A2U01_0119183, partial [Trifolium medium]|nr:hypothetical protein [Trifolium medium]
KLKPTTQKRIQYQQHVPCKAEANRKNDDRGDLNVLEDRILEEKAPNRTGKHETGGAEADLVTPH